MIQPKKIPTLSDQSVEKFHATVLVNELTGCHEWQASLNNSGYGRFWTNSDEFPAHRVAWYLHTGAQVPDGLQIDHLCRNRRCVNPAHLEPVSSQINTLRGVGPSAINATKHECPRGHQLAGNNLIPALLDRGRACRACDVAARGARHRGLQGEEREAFIKERADSHYEKFMVGFFPVPQGVAA